VWQWRGKDARRQFIPAHVNVQARMMRRVLSIPHRFICVSDEVTGFDSSLIEVIPTPPAAVMAGRLSSPEGPRFPSCYRRLWTWSGEALELFGERVLLLDIDLVAMRCFAPLLERSEDFVGWRPNAKWGHPDRVAGGMYMLRTGSRTEVWDRFEGTGSIAAARRANFRGSDQAWISFCVGKDAAVWPENCGLYSIRDLKAGLLPLPEDARIVQFNGPQKPWTSALGWVKDHWN